MQRPWTAFLDRSFVAGRWPPWRSPTVDEKMKVTGHVGPLDDKVSELQRNFGSRRTKPNKPSRRGIHSDVEKISCQIQRCLEARETLQIFGLTLQEPHVVSRNMEGRKLMRSQKKNIAKKMKEKKYIYIYSWETPPKKKRCLLGYIFGASLPSFNVAFMSSFSRRDTNFITSPLSRQAAVCLKPSSVSMAFWPPRVM